ncbi:YchJ family protein [Aliarcobacter butzleri]|uniref:YchJ family metal-binding protein n=1 Tax=Aliarcobacter butzleri TaxID=28197 RepID=A0AAP4UXT3_9BACT|nr:YchJ family metal-binding protein [Aliarcobacter butzleri]MCG3676559.1 SEC-C domain-containing protein [Aliarcobacter butzleri]MCG3687268.1 SEC-C domain-containing protein [Aliarcobacter butzleri]MDN5051029.1 YchJ family metal-binding protein [Aliarcobacter butzleri]MDN5074356.1 YchJ family metal-binding protein [Aliarcobacter butzleri]MDN5115521.1 YchJ family metal-binding protein [Aliarcobacter butzleri]
MKISVNSLCPCGSLKKYKKCCKIFHDNIKKPSNALELMKSRFSAYAFEQSEYIIKTTYKDNPDFSTNISVWKEEIEMFSKNKNFEKLEILNFEESDFEAFVTFKATLFQNNNDISFIEKSKFKKLDGIWLYVDGEFYDKYEELLN